MPGFVSVSLPAPVVPTRLCSVVLGQAALMVMCIYRAFSEHLFMGLCEDVPGSQRSLDADQLHAFGKECSIPLLVDDELGGSTLYLPSWGLSKLMNPFFPNQST